MACYRTVIWKDPKNYYSYWGLGKIYYNKGEYNKAIENYLKALAINPNLTDIHLNLGVAYKSTNDRGKARECFEKYLMIDKNHKKVRKEL